MNPNENSTDPSQESVTPPSNNLPEQQPASTPETPTTVPEAQPPVNSSPVVVETPANQPNDTSNAFNPFTTTVSGSPANTPQQGPTAEDPGKTLGVFGFILSLFGFGVISLVLSILGRSKSKAAGHSNGLALAGIIISILTIVLSIVIFSLLAFGAFKAAEYCQENGSTVQSADGSTTTVSCSDDISTSTGDNTNTDGNSTMQFDTLPEGSGSIESDTQQ